MAARAPSQASGQGLAWLFCSLTAAVSALPGWNGLLFPELAALSSTVLRDPHGPWARRSRQLVWLPTLTATLGLLISRQGLDPALALLLAVVLAKAVLVASRSSLVPALSAAALPVILQLRSWTYPLQIALGLVALSLVLQGWSRRVRPGVPEPAADVEPPAAGQAPQPWRSLRWLALLVMLLVVQRGLGLHDVVVPPLIVIAHEALVTPERCPWLGRIWLLPFACGAVTLVGVAAARLLPGPGAAAAVSLAAALWLLHRLRLRLAPVLALSLLPLVMPSPDLRLVPAVVLGAGLLALAVSRPRRPPAGSAARTPPGPAAAPDRCRGRR